jgi:hypothetical protein
VGVNTDRYAQVDTQHLLILHGLVLPLNISIKATYACMPASLGQKKGAKSARKWPRKGSVRVDKVCVMGVWCVCLASSSLDTNRFLQQKKHHPSKVLGN